MVLKSERNSPMLSPSSPPVCTPLLSPVAYYLSAMSNVVQREAGVGSCLSQPRDSSHEAQQNQTTPPLLLCSSFTYHFSDKLLPTRRIFQLISCLSLPNPFISSSFLSIWLVLVDVLFCFQSHSYHRGQ